MSQYRERPECRVKRLNILCLCVTCIQIVHGVKVTIESEVRGTLPNSHCTAPWRLNIYVRCKSRTTNFCEKGSCRCWAPNKVPSAHFTLSSAHCTLQVTLHTACSKFHNSCHCTLQMQVLGNWSILCRIIIRRQWMQQRLIFVKHLFAKRV